MPDIRHAITVDAPSDRVSQLVSAADGLAVWWAEDVVKVPGSPAIELGFFDRSMRGTVAYRIERDEIGSRVTIRNLGQAPGFAPRWLLTFAMRRAVTADLRRLQRAVEGST